MSIQGLLPFDRGGMGSDQNTDLSEFYSIENPQEYDLAFGVLDAFRIRISHIFDKLSSLSNSRTRLLPHQLEATHRVVNSLKPRFLLADEVGLGKTIEAGLIIKELILRNGYRRVLICVPAPLAVQWQQEMKSKFNEEFTILSRKNFDFIAASWSHHKKIITSIDFIKNEKYGSQVLKLKWDIAVFDEAHRLRRDYSKITRAYSFAEKISEKTDAFLLLSATPFRGKLEELFYLIRLIDPHILGPHSAFIQEFQNGNSANLRGRLSRVLVRRRKVEVGGFTKRFAATIRFDLSIEERALYDATTEYVKREYNLAMQEKNRAVGFVMIVFQKLLDSSTRALLRALERRKQHLENCLHGSPALKNVFADEDEIDPEDMDDLEEPEEALDRIHEEYLKSIQDMRKEILTLNHLCMLGRRIKSDRKLIKLKETLLKLRKKGHTKYIIFTQFRTTQDYLAENLSEFSITLFHGSLNLNQKEEAVKEFKDKTEIFICTEAGGEGRNLQFGNVLINYDLPWSPLKIEQRIGRIHRFGQLKDVYVFNFSTRDTVAERVLEVLEKKIQLFEDSIGPGDSLLGSVQDEGEFQKNFMTFVTGTKTKADFDAELDEKLKIAKDGYTKLNELIAPQMVDFNLDDYYQHTKEERFIDNDNIEKLTLNYLSLKEDERYRLSKIPNSYSISLAEYMIEERLEKRSKPATFRSEIALEKDSIEFLAAGHPLVDNALNYFLNHEKRRSIQKMPAGREGRGFYFIFLCRFLSGMDRTDIIGCFVRNDKPVSAFIPEEIMIKPGFRYADMNPGFNAVSEESISIEVMNACMKKASECVLDEGMKRADKLKKDLHSIFKKEEYKLEISYGKKIRQLDEKRDRQKLRYRMTPSVENRAVLTRTENELSRTKAELESAVEKNRRESRIEVKLDLLQVYHYC